jgi:hypothetical protein
LIKVLYLKPKNSLSLPITNTNHIPKAQAKKGPVHL